MTTNQPLIPLSQAEAPFFLGVDVGGTNIKIGLVDNQGKTLAFKEIDTLEPDGPQAAVARMADTCKELCGAAGLDFAKIARIGLGTPGSMDIARGLLIEPPNHPHWHHFPIRQALETASGHKVSFINDANAAAFGEFWVGTGEKHNSMVLLTLGTGVGGGIIVDGHLINGINSFGSECGHVIVDSSSKARLCVWGGGRGHLEAYASASAVAAITTDGLKAGAASSLQTPFKAGEKISARRVYEAAEGGDAFALEIIDSTANYLAIGITTMVHIVDPGLVVLGGAMDFGGHQSQVGMRFLNRIRSEFKELTFSNVAAGTTIDFATLGGDAGYLGAAGIARDDFLKLGQR